MGADAPCEIIDSGGLRKIRLLPPSETNPRNSEGSFLELTDGRIMFCYSHFTSGGQDHAAAHLAARYSSDGGLNWTDTDEIVLSNEGEMNVMSVSMLRLQDGRCALLYVRKNAFDDCRPHLRISEDEGRTWDDPRLCIPDLGYFVVNNDRMIQLASGRLVIPTALHGYDGKTLEPGISMCYLSDDGGESWRRSENILHAPEGSRAGLQEPGTIELADGRLMMLCRTDQGCQYRSWSSDGGNTWSEAEPTDLIAPVSPASMKRIPATGDILLVWNDHSRIDESLEGLRTPLTVAISRDEGQTWENTRTIDDDRNGWYCYVAIEFVGDRVLLGHCAGDRRTGGLNLTQITVFDVDWLYQ